MGLCFYTAELWDYLIHTYKEAVTFIKDLWSIWNFCFLVILMLLRHRVRAENFPKDTCGLCYSPKVNQSHLCLQKKQSLTTTEDKSTRGIYNETITSLKEQHSYVFSTSEVLKTIDCSWGKIKVPIYTFHCACEAEKEMNLVVKVCSSLRQFHCFSVGKMSFNVISYRKANIQELKSSQKC